VLLACAARESASPEVEGRGIEPIAIELTGAIERMEI
jgi:hypothetical protein